LNQQLEYNYPFSPQIFSFSWEYSSIQKACPSMNVTSGLLQRPMHLALAVKRQKIRIIVHVQKNKERMRYTQTLNRIF